MTRDGSTHKDNPFSKRSKPVNISRKRSRPKNRDRAEIEDGISEWQSGETLDMATSKEGTLST